MLHRDNDDHRNPHPHRCIETTTTTGTHTHTDTSTSITQTSITTVTVTFTGTTTHTRTSTQTATSATQTATSVTDTSTVSAEVTTAGVDRDDTTTETYSTVASTTVAETPTPGPTTQGPAAIMRLAMRVEVTNVDDYREYFEDPSVRQAYVDVMSRVANVSSEMIDVRMSTPRLGSIVVQYTLTIPYTDAGPRISLESIENKLSTLQMATFNELLDEAMDRVAGAGHFEQKVVSVTVVDDIPVNMAGPRSVDTILMVMALALWWRD